MNTILSASASTTKALTLAVMSAAGVLLHAVSLPAAPPPSPKYKVTEVANVAYYDGPDADPVRHKLDLYLPKGKKDYPVLCLVHGGAWVLGTKTHRGLYPAVGQCLAEQGIGAVLPNYRLSPAVKHPEHVKDIARAFAWTHQNIAKHGGRPDQLFIAGHSAGGHLAALLGTDETYLKGVGLSLKAVKGVIGVSGVYYVPNLQLNLNVALPRRAAIMEGLNLNIRYPLFALVFGDDPKVRMQASPLTHVRPGLPPFLLLYGERDLPYLDKMAKDFGAALKENQCDVQVFEATNRTHFSVMFRATTPDDSVAEGIARFIRQHAKP